MLKIISDSREQTPLIFSDQVEVITRGLAVGDYSLEGMEDQIVIERKSLSDLLGSITSGRERFTKELRQLRSFRFACIVVEADWDDITEQRYNSDVHPNAVLASLMSFTMKYGIQIIMAGDHGKASRLVERLFSLYVAMIERDYKAVCVVGGSKPLKTPANPSQEFIVGSVPGGKFAGAHSMMDRAKR